MEGERRSIDFHSFRRAFSTALAELDVSAQRAMHLAGHSDLRAHARYVMESEAMKLIPVGALPDLEAARIVLESSGVSTTLAKSERDTGFEPATLSLGS